MIMREIQDHKVNPANDKLQIVVVDEPGAGGANHEYRIVLPPDSKSSVDSFDISFQNGPINEVGVNGVTQEALLAIVVDRLKSFQAGPYSCKENSVALTHTETALLWLQKRTLDRMRRGVEGTMQK